MVDRTSIDAKIDAKNVFKIPFLFVEHANALTSSVSENLLSGYYLVPGHLSGKMKFNMSVLVYLWLSPQILRSIRFLCMRPEWLNPPSDDMQ